MLSVFGLFVQIRDEARHCRFGNGQGLPVAKPYAETIVEMLVPSVLGGRNIALRQTSKIS